MPSLPSLTFACPAPGDGERGSLGSRGASATTRPGPSGGTAGRSTLHGRSGALATHHASSTSGSYYRESCIKMGGERKRNLHPPLSTSNLCQTRGLAASPGSCRTVIGHDEACGGDRWRRSDGADVGGRARAWRASTSPSSSGAPSQDLAGSRAGGLHSRTIEVLDQRGIADRFLSQGKVMQVAGFAMIPLDISDFPTRHNYGLALWQNHIERILAAWVDELAVPIYRGREVTGFAQDDTGVDVELSDGRSLRAKYLVGCDGGRSLIRKKAGIDFPGWDPSVSYLIAEVEMTEEPAWGIRRGEKGINALGKLEDGKRVRVVLIEPHVRQGDEPTLDDLREALIAVYGTDFGVHNVTWLSRFTDMARQAASYRERRVLLAGDAAHVHSPAGGQGLNIGVQDAVNLGWKLAQVVNGTSPESLLDTYQAERHPIGARVLKNTMAQTALNRGDERTKALRETMSELLEDGRASQAIRRDDVWSRHSLRPRHGTPAARAPHARSRLGHRKRPTAGVHPAARCPTGTAQSR